MRICVTTCNRYDHLMRGFAYCFNRYWPGQDVDVFAFRPQPDLPSNFRVTVSTNPDSKSKWTDNLRPFFDGMGDHFVWLLDDYWLCDVVDQKLVARLESLLLQYDLGKADLSNNTNHFEHVPSRLGEDLVEAKPGAGYRWSTQPAIWGRKYIMATLVPGRSPWEYELHDVPGASDYRVLGTRGQVYNYANVYYKGKTDPYMLSRLNDDDLTALRDLGALTHMDPVADIVAIKTLRPRY